LLRFAKYVFRRDRGDARIGAFEPAETQLSERDPEPIGPGALPPSALGCVEHVAQFEARP
jgi:hypothetical protein